MKSATFPELTRSPDALQKANLWFFSAFRALVITEIRKAYAIRSSLAGWGIAYYREMT